MKQAAQAIAQEGAVSRLFRRQRDELQVAQALKTVAEAERVALHRHDAELAPARLHVEEEEQTVEVGDALPRQLTNVELLVVRLLLLDLQAVADRLVAEQHDRLLRPELQIRGDRECVLVAPVEDGELLALEAEGLGELLAEELQRGNALAEHDDALAALARHTHVAHKSHEAGELGVSLGRHLLRRPAELAEDVHVMLRIGVSLAGGAQSQARVRKACFDRFDQRLRR